jgi:kynurenine formamidase
VRVIDLTGPLEPGIWRYDDAFPAFASEPATSIEEHGFVVQRVTIGTHMGTHTDALGHLVADGPMIEGMALESYVGRVSHFRFRDLGPLAPITAGALSAAGVRPASGDVVLIETGWGRKWNEPDFVTSHPFITLDGAAWLIEHGAKCVGMDTPGLMDPRIDLGPNAAVDSATVVDRVLLEARICYVAGLVNLEALTETRPLFVAVPLKLTGLDGAPVRAIAIEGLE